MNFFLKSTTALMISASTLFADPAGVRDLSMEAPHHGRAVTGALYYPSAGGGSAERYADNPIFVGTPILKDAEFADGKYPLVLMSHGMGGHVRSLGWLSTALAERGAIVVAVNHPNSTWGDFDLLKGLEHWTRVQDLKLALETVLADPEIGAHVDTSQVMAAGFSFGGWTVLSMGGLKGNLKGSTDHCAEYGTASSHCADMARGNVDWGSVDTAQWNADYRDPRISSVFAIDPALIWGMTSENAASMAGDVTLMSLGEGEHRLLATDFDLAKLPAALPNADIIRIPNGVHFSVLPVCKPDGAAILAEEKDDPVCTDPEGTDRAAVHDKIIEAMAAKLGL